MSLQIEVATGEKLYVGSAVIQNVGFKTKLLIKGDLPILRERDYLSTDQATTPCRRLYELLQRIYLSDGDVSDLERQFIEMATNIKDRAPSTVTLVAEVSSLFLLGEHYKALRACHALIGHEDAVMENFHKNNRAVG